VFAFGDAPELALNATVKLASPVIGFTVTPQETGAWLAEQDGTVLNIGTATPHGSLWGVTTPVSAIAGIVPPSPDTLSYDLAEANGKVAALGKAAYYGSAYGKHLTAPIVALLPTPDRKGYWLVGADGSVFAFGDAKPEGSAGGRVRQDPVVAAATTPDGGGYWLVTEHGRVLHFGDAGAYGSLKQPFTGRVVGIVGTPDGQGYWIACRSGQVFNFGDAPNFGSVGVGSTGQAVVAIATTPDGGGYWLARANGNLAHFGDAVRLAPLAPVKTKSPVVSMAVTPDGTGDWEAEENGTVVSLGAAEERGSLAKLQGAAPVTAIAAMPVTSTSPLQYPSGSFGYDINWPQCKGAHSSDTVPLPGAPSYPSGTGDYTIAIVGVDGWAVGAPNPCLRAEVQWAEAAKGTNGAPYDLYMFLNSPTSSDTIDQQGPDGDCTSFSGQKQASCLAYNYGYNSAQLAMSYAASQGASSPMWWLDIENDLCGQYWSCDQTLNSLTIQGALDYLHSEKVTAGIYSTAVQWQGITGGYVPSGPQIPIWVAGAYWTSPPYPANYGYWPPSTLAPYCTAKYAFAGGDTWLLQETPGPNNYPFDPDYAC
jgi:hypothetical protein